MTTSTKAQPWTALEALVEQGDAGALATFLETLPHGEAGRAMAHLSADGRRSVVELLTPDQGAALVSALPGLQAAELVEELPRESAAAIVEAMPGQGQGDVLGAMPEAEAAAILSVMGPEAAEAARELASYGAETAGGLMATEFLAFPLESRVADVLDDLRTHAERYTDYDVQYAYVTDEERRLVGVLRLRDLLLERPARPISELMVRDPRRVLAREGLESLEHLFDEVPFLAVPVVNDAMRLLGVVRRADVEVALGDRERSDHMKLAGIVGGEELRSMPTLARSGRRLAWLSANVVLNVLAASVIAAYQETLAAVIALAVFLPIISDMSGCSGSQAVAVTMRELSLGLVKPRDLLHVLRKELGVGLLNGAALGAILAVVAWTWKGNPWLGLVVGVALAVNTSVAVCLGGIVPLLLKRMNKDPALASGPILTTCTDMCGFFAVLALATALLPRLT